MTSGFGSEKDAAIGEVGRRVDIQKRPLLIWLHFRWRKCFIREFTSENARTSWRERPRSFGPLSLRPSMGRRPSSTTGKSNATPLQRFGREQLLGLEPSREKVLFVRITKERVERLAIRL